MQNKYLLDQRELNTLYSALCDSEDLNNDDGLYTRTLWQIFNKIKAAKKEEDVTND